MASYYIDDLFLLVVYDKNAPHVFNPWLTYYYIKKKNHRFQ